MLPWVIVILGSFFIGCFHLQRMLSKPHYQYLVFLPLMMWAIAKTRPAQRSSVIPLGWFSNTGVLLSACLLCAASLLWSPWTAVFAVLSSAFFYCLGSYSRSEFKNWFPVWLMSVFVLPLPFGWDERITLKLRGLATEATSQLLDFFGVLHIQYVNVIEVPSKKLFIADACSGIHSLYVLLSASFFWGVLQKRSILHMLAFLGTTIILVLIENTSRLVIVVAALSWQIDLSEGIDHQILGGILFLLSALLILSTDRLLFFFFPGKNSLIESRDRAVAKALRNSSAGPSIYLSILLFIVAGFVQWVFMPGPLPNVLASFQDETALKILDEKTLPDAVEGFRRESFKHIERVPGDPFGQQSQQWTFSDGTGLVVQVSIDYPFEGFHDSTVCYSQVGWLIDGTLVVNDDQSQYAIVNMKQKLEGEAILVFCQIDQDGVVYARLKDRTSNISSNDIRQRVQSLLTLSPPPVERPAKLPLIQFQLLARSSSRLQENDLPRIERFFTEFRRLAVAALNLPAPKNLSSNP